MADDDEYLKPTELTFGEWLDTWMKDYKKNSVRPATYTSYGKNRVTEASPGAYPDIA